MVLDALFAGLIALGVSAVLSLLLRRRAPGPAGGFVFFFVILFLATWATAAWVVPGGPGPWHVYWLAILVAGILFGLLFAVVIPPAPRGSMAAREEPLPHKAAEVAAITSMAFFWALVVLTVAAIAVRYALGR
jgi:hypothetical protein